MNKIPLSLIFMTSTKGHFGFKEIYKDTLNDLNKQIPLSNFSFKIAHIKMSTNDDAAMKEMTKELESRGFKVVVTVADWSHGQSHQNEYMKDLVKVSKEIEIYKNHHILWLEDDSTMTCHKESLDKILFRMIHMIEENPNTLTARFLRKNDFASSPIEYMEDENADYFWSPHFNFQPAIMRSRDFFTCCKAIEDNFDKISNVQCEALWRFLLAPLSRSNRKHIVWNPSYAETIHLGIMDYENVKKQLK